MSTKPPPKDPVICSFCGKPQQLANKMVVGPEVNICDSCIVVCNSIVGQQDLPGTPDLNLASSDEGALKGSPLKESPPNEAPPEDHSPKDLSHVPKPKEVFDFFLQLNPIVH